MCSFHPKLKTPSPGPQTLFSLSLMSQAKFLSSSRVSGEPGCNQHRGHLETQMRKEMAAPAGNWLMQLRGH